MPELPEVEQTKRYLEKYALNRRIISVMVLDGGILEEIDEQTFRQDLIGRSMTNAGRRGKQMFIGLDDGSFLTIHLGMTGDMIISEDDQVPKYSRLALRFEDGANLFYVDQRKFGAIGVVGSIDRFVVEHRLGPDALCINRSDFVERVSVHKKAIKSVLLDQSVISGIGNLYADEALFQVRLHPAMKANVISQRKLADLYSQIGTILRASIAVSSDFAALPNGYLLRVRREGAECPRGNGPLAMIRIGGRTSIFCPRCQRSK
jgi:formamidopyrimidine-DNA glycosylase